MPALTDPSFVGMVATADEETRLFTLRRGDLLLAVNFGEAETSVGVAGALLFSTPSAPAVTASGLRIPPHAGVLVRLDGWFD